MGTTSRTSSERPSSRESDGGAAELARESEYDLLTAALIGVAVGAGAALLLGVGAGYRRPRPSRMQRAMKRGRKMAREQGAALSGMPHAVRRQVEEYLAAARDTIADTVDSELRDFRKAVRRRRRRLGI